MITIKQIEIAGANWIKASIELKFDIFSPFIFENNGIKKNAFALLPEYGSPHGTILGLISAPEFETDSAIVEWAKMNNLYYSFINIESCLYYDEVLIKETLEDWKKY